MGSKQSHGNYCVCVCMALRTNITSNLFLICLCIYVKALKTQRCPAGANYISELVWEIFKNMPVLPISQKILIQVYKGKGSVLRNMTEINLPLLSLVEDSFEQQKELERWWQPVGMALLFLKLGRCVPWDRSDFSFLGILSNITYILGLLCLIKVRNLVSTSLPWLLKNVLFCFHWSVHC